MKKLRGFILSFLFTRREKAIIWNSLWYSKKCYKDKGDLESAIVLQIVMEANEWLTTEFRKENLTEVDKEAKDEQSEYKDAKETEEIIKKVREETDGVNKPLY